MNNSISIEHARAIMGSNLIGPAELKSTGFLCDESIVACDIPFSEKELIEKKNDYLLILGVDHMSDGSDVSIRNLKRFFGKDPKISEPCFYNQDWYDNEEFIDNVLRAEWFLIRKNVYENSRSVQPEELMKSYVFPSAIKCTYAFFVAWHVLGVKLWYHDFVWCSDTDHNGDRIYVGKYNDVDGLNKNGFSIHRHLALRSCYCCID